MLQNHSPSPIGRSLPGNTPHEAQSPHVLRTHHVRITHASGAHHARTPRARVAIYNPCPLGPTC